MSAVGDFFGKSTGASDGPKAKGVDINKDDFKDQNNDNVNDRSNFIADNAGKRAAPKADAAQTDLSQVERVTGAKIGANERSEGGNLSGAYTSQAARANAQGINTGQEQQWRDKQSALADSLTKQANGQGPSVATETMKAAGDRAIAQQLGVAATQGGNPAMAQRNAAVNAAATSRGIANDAASARIQEQNDARGQLAGVVAGARGQDQNMALNDAQLRQQTELANAGFNQQTNLSNADAFNQNSIQRAQMQQQNNQFNAGQTNNTNLSQAQLVQQANLANQGAYNTGLFGNTGYRQQTNLANQDASLRQTSMNDQATQAAIDNLIRQGQISMQGNENYEQLNVDQNLGVQGMNSQNYNSSAGRSAGFLGGMLNAGGGAAALALSDPAVKSDVKPMATEDYVKEEGDRAHALMADDDKAHKQDMQKQEALKQLPGKMAQSIGSKMGGTPQDPGSNSFAQYLRTRPLTLGGR